MFKNIQEKIILIFFLIGIIIISGLGVFFINSLNLINTQVQNKQLEQISEISTTINNVTTNTKVALLVAGIGFAIVAIIIAVILSKFVIYPINKLIESAEKITEKDMKNNRIFKNKKNGEVGNLENVFGVMTTELKEKLSEVSTQKNQIETILLHMTDGIIAFNMQGDII